MCVCVRVCARAHVRVCACVHARALVQDSHAESPHTTNTLTWYKQHAVATMLLHHLASAGVRQLTTHLAVVPAQVSIGVHCRPPTAVTGVLVLPVVMVTLVLYTGEQCSLTMQIFFCASRFHYSNNQTN